jgi:micrococcal nuclease
VEVTLHRVRRGVAGAAVILLVAGCSTSLSSSGAHAARHRATHSARPDQTSTPQPAASSHPTRHHGVLRPKGPRSRGWRVYDVVDGDTVKVTDGRRDRTLRLIGMDTPEVVDPATPVECFGPQASANAHRVLDGRRVVLEFDPSQGRLDKYGRTLAYLWVKGSRGLRLYNRSAIQQGFAKEYTYDQPYAWRSSFLRAERAAQQHRRGLWSVHTCDGDTTQPAGASSQPGQGGGSRSCAPGYSPCLPVVPDLNCADIGHPVKVTGADQYHLDGDHDGVACE